MHEVAEQLDELELDPVVGGEVVGHLVVAGLVAQDGLGDGRRDRNSWIGLTPARARLHPHATRGATCRSRASISGQSSVGCCPSL